MEFVFLERNKSRADVATRFNKTLQYAKITYKSNKKFVSKFKNCSYPSEDTYEVAVQSYCWPYYFKNGKWIDDYHITSKTRKAVEDVFEYAKSNSINNFFYHVEYDGNKEYFHYIPASITYIIASIAERNLKEEIYCGFSKSTNYKGHDEHFWDEHLESDKPVFGSLEFYSKNAKEIQPFIDEFNRIFEASPYKDDFEITIECKKTCPRRPKVAKKTSDKERLELANKAYTQLVETLPAEVLSFFKKNNLADAFKDDFIKNAIDDELNYIYLEATLMMGDADGYDDISEGFYKAEFEYIAEWLKAYQKKYPKENEDKCVLCVERDCYTGSLLYKDVCEIFKSFKPKTLSYNGHVSGVMSTRHIKDSEWENELETDVEATLDDLIDEYPESISNVLLPYATYWNLHGKSDDALIELDDAW